MDHAESPSRGSDRDKLHAFFSGPGLTQAELVERMVNGALACEEEVAQHKKKTTELTRELERLRREIAVAGPTLASAALPAPLPLMTCDPVAAMEHMRSVKLGQLEVQIGKAQAQLHATRQQNAAAKQQLQQTQLCLQQVERQKVQVTRELQAREAESTELAAKLSAAKQVVDDLTAQQQELDKSLANLTSELAHAQEQLTDAEQGLNELEDSRQQVEQDMATAKEQQQLLLGENVKLQNSKQQLEQQLLELQKNKSAVESELGALECSVAEATSRKAEVEGILQEMLKEQQSAEDRLEALLEQHQVLLEDLRQATDNKVKVQDEAAAAELQVQDTRSQLQVLQEQLQEQQVANATAQQQLTSLHAQLEAANKAVHERQPQADPVTVKPEPGSVEQRPVSQLAEAAVTVAEVHATDVASAAVAQQALQEQLTAAMETSEQNRQHMQQTESQLIVAPPLPVATPAAPAEDARLHELQTPDAALVAAAAAAEAVAADALGVPHEGWIANPTFHVPEDAGSDDGGTEPFTSPAAVDDDDEEEEEEQEGTTAMCLHPASASPTPADVVAAAAQELPTIAEHEPAMHEASLPATSGKVAAHGARRSSSAGPSGSQGAAAGDDGADSDTGRRSVRKRRSTLAPAVSQDVSERTPAAGPGKRARGSTASYGTEGLAAPPPAAAASARRVTRSASRTESGATSLVTDTGSVTTGGRSARKRDGAAVKTATALDPIDEEVQSAAVTGTAEASKKPVATAVKPKQQPKWH